MCSLLLSSSKAELPSFRNVKRKFILCNMGSYIVSAAVTAGTQLITMTLCHTKDPTSHYAMTYGCHELVHNLGSSACARLDGIDIHSVFQKGTHLISVKLVQI